MRAVLGLLLLLTSVTGLLHLATFRAEGDPVADLKRAGGGLGALASIPLQGVAGTVAATSLLVALGMAAVLVLTGRRCGPSGSG